MWVQENKRLLRTNTPAKLAELGAEAAHHGCGGGRNQARATGSTVRCLCLIVALHPAVHQRHRNLCTLHAGLPCVGGDQSAETRIQLHTTYKTYT